MACPLVLPTIAPELDFVTKKTSHAGLKVTWVALSCLILRGMERGRAPFGARRWGFFGLRSLGMTPSSSGPWFLTVREQLFPMTQAVSFHSLFSRRGSRPSSL